ncbi:MAG: YheC/YheD family protein [Dethiobacter sp.]|nr:YheC/YheD family protein [Dethiobacter sp.]
MNSRANLNHLRPLIGVFVNKKFLRKRKVPLFARKLSQANQKAKCSIYFFTSQNISWRKQIISGYVLKDSSKQWLERRLPFPDIIYDRGVGFVGGEKAEAKKLRARFKNTAGIQYINSCKLKKWQVHQKLSRHKAVKKYLPATTFSRGMEDIRAMMAKYGYLFLKSSGGSGGKGVFALEKCNRGFCFRYYHEGTHLKRYGANLDGLCKEMKKIGLKPDRVILQQGIRLIKYKNHPMDLRVLMVKDKDGIWNAVYNQARVAQKGAVITNTSLGGEVMNYSDIYPALKKRYPGIPSDREIKDTCVVIARYIEKEFGPFGEIGIDIAVDKTGKVWLLEANSKPDKLPEQKIEDTVGISPQFLLPLEYAKLLYSTKKPGIGSEPDRES